MKRSGSIRKEIRGDMQRITWKAHISYHLPQIKLGFPLLSRHLLSAYASVASAELVITFFVIAFTPSPYQFLAEYSHASTSNVW